MTTEQILSETLWSDMELRGLHWIEGGRDLVLNLRLSVSGCGETKQDWFLYCRWAANLTINLSYSEKEGGYPLTWDVNAERTSMGEWLIYFDFANLGELKFRCSKLDLKKTQ